MKRVLGALLVIGGAFCLYRFVAGGMFHARDLFSASFDAGLPFAALGRNYPSDALTLAGAFWGFVVGIGLILAPAAAPAAAAAGSASSRFAASPRTGGRIARLMLLNAMLLVSSLFVAYIGAKAKQDVTTIAVFGAVASLQVLFGLILLLMALTERPKGPVSLVLGILIYLAGAGVGALAFLWGGA